MTLFLGEIIVFFGIAILLFYVDFFGTIIILLITIVFTFLIYTFTKGKIDVYAQERITVDTQLNKHLLQGIASAKDIKILDREGDLIHQFYKNLLKLSKVKLFIKFINGLPKFLFEILIVCAFIIIVLSMINSNRDTISIIQYLGVFGMASFRIIPGATKIFTSFQQLRYRQVSVKLLSKEFGLKDNFYLQKKSQHKDLNMSMKFQKEINLRNLYFTYPIRKEFS